MILSPPELINKNHHLCHFSSGEENLDAWLKTKALKNQKNNASRTYVVSDNGYVIAYYALASSTIVNTLATSNFRRNMPNPVPVVVLGRLAVHINYQHLGIGKALVRDAGLRVIKAAETIGIRGLLVHAISETAKHFYEKLGFEASSIDPMTLMITLNNLKAATSVNTLDRSSSLCIL